VEGSTLASQTGEQKGQAEVKHHLKRARTLLEVLSDNNLSVSLLHWESWVRDHYEMLMVLISDLIYNALHVGLEWEQLQESIGQ